MTSANGKILIVSAATGLCLLLGSWLVISWSRAHARAGAGPLIALLRGYRQEFGEWPDDLEAVRKRIRRERRLELLEGLDVVSAERLGSRSGNECLYRITYSSPFSLYTERWNLRTSSLPETRVRSSFTSSPLTREEVEK